MVVRPIVANNNINASLLSKATQKFNEAVFPENALRLPIFQHVTEQFLRSIHHLCRRLTDPPTIQDRQNFFETWMNRFTELFSAISSHLNRVNVIRDAVQSEDALQYLLPLHRRMILSNVAGMMHRLMDCISENMEELNNREYHTMEQSTSTLQIFHVQCVQNLTVFVLNAQIILGSLRSVPWRSKMRKRMQRSDQTVREYSHISHPQQEVIAALNKDSPAESHSEAHEKDSHSHSATSTNSFQTKNSPFRYAHQQSLLQNSIKETKFTAAQGHGFATEQVNTSIDRWLGRNAKVIGDCNRKLGPDRIVDGVLIQSKYCKKPADIVRSILDKDGKWKYVDQIVEVPRGLKAQVIKLLEKKGIPDAKERIVAGHLTYKGAVSVAKSGTIWSLAWDASKGVVYSAIGGSITMLVFGTLALASGKSWQEALEESLIVGSLTSMGIFRDCVLIGQIAKSKSCTHFMKKVHSLIPSEVWKLDAIQKIAHTTPQQCRLLSHYSGLLLSGFITTVVSPVLFSIPDIRSCYTGRMYKEEVIQNFSVRAAGSLASFTGCTAGGFIGTLALPGIGTTVGGSCGSIVGGVLLTVPSEFLTSKVMKLLIPDHRPRFMQIYRYVYMELSYCYLLTDTQRAALEEHLQLVDWGKCSKMIFRMEQDKQVDEVRKLMEPSFLHVLSSKD